ncbi:MAG: sulfite exporter TauE/SafE family protein [Candidatus Bathyarchaeota archaeon]|nr:sulfite exporter TauE/SafE family protein [Candidatus Bathyarchaeota archaeon]
MEPTTIAEILLLPILALIVGVVAAMLGIGGGVFVVPALQLLPLTLEFSPQMAAGTSLAMIVFKSLSSSSSYARQRRIDYKTGGLLAAATIPGALIGALLTTRMPKDLLILIFAFFLLYLAARMIFSRGTSNRKGAPSFRAHRFATRWRRRLVDSQGHVYEYASDLTLGLPLSFFAGVASGLFGIGGGSLIVPILHFVLCFPMHVAVATSVFIMIFTSISGVVTHVSIGNVQFDYALILSIGVIVGAQIGARISGRISGRNLRTIFGFVLVLVSFRMILKLLS